MPHVHVGRYTVRWYLRNVVRITVAVSFLAMASGLTLQLHRANVPDPGHHNDTHCALCEAILVGAMKLHLDSPSTVVHTDRFFSPLPEPGAVSPPQRMPAILGPRPPPPGTA